MPCGEALGPVIEIKMTVVLTAGRVMVGPCGSRQQLGTGKGEGQRRGFVFAGHAVYRALGGLSAFLASLQAEGGCSDWPPCCLADILCCRDQLGETP